MEGYQPGTYGARYAAEYDAWHANFMDTEGALTALAKLARDGPALEFGSGTGRLAVPLAELGLDVSAIEIAPEMVARMKAKPGGDRVRVMVGDMTRARLDQRFSLVYAGHSTLMQLPDQQAQVTCFRNAARHLVPGGHFALETLTVSGAERTVLRCEAVEADRVVLHLGVYDPVTGGYSGNRLVLEPTGIRFYPTPGRPVGHGEMDLMAELAGLRLAHRWGDWHGGPFTPSSYYHVSIYRLPAD